MICPKCHGTGVYDPIAIVADHTAQSDAFADAYPRLHCPTCRKRVSVMYANVDAHSHSERVRMHCSHCDHRFTVPRVPGEVVDYGTWEEEA